MRLSLLALAACASTPNLALRPESPAPQGQEVGSFGARDGTQLWRRKWVPSGQQKGVLIIQHGLRDHSDNYDRLARRVAAQGIAVWAMDLRGHARSAGARVDPRPWHVYVEDFAQFIEIVATAEPNQPIFLMGHSMGGAIAALTVIEKQPARIAGLILSAPVLNLGVAPFAVAGVRLVGAIMPSLGVLKLDPDAFSTNPEIAKKLVKDPLVEQGAGPARTGAGLADAAADIFDNVHKLKLPILALHGTVDELTAPSGSRALIERTPSSDKTLRIYEGFGHDLVHEPQGVQVEDDIIAWLAAHTGGPPVRPPPIYRGPLRGDPAGRVVAFSIGGGIFGTREDPISTGLFETSLHLARLSPVGWGGGLHVVASGDGFFASLLPLGGTIRLGVGAFTVATGVSTVPDGFNLAIPAAAWLELPVGPVHATASAQLDYRVADDPQRIGPLSSDLAQVALALRVPGDRRYWPHAFAGAGPYIRGAILDAGGPSVYQLTAGIALYGAD